MSALSLTARNAEMGDLVALLRDQQARKVDLVVPARALHADAGDVIVTGSEAVLSEDGVTVTDGRYRPTSIFDEGVADKLGIPLAYVRKLRDQRPDLWDANVNGWLRDDERTFMLRAYTGGEAGVGIARALLSDKYARIDNLDVLVAALDGVKRAGVTVDVDGADLSERRMEVRLVAPEVTALAPVLLRGYRSPFGDPEIDAQRNHGWTLERARSAAAREGKAYTPGEEPVVWAGLALGNSETGGGAFTITPRLIVEACMNGLKIKVDALRSVHLGGKLEEGVVRWSDATQRKALDLITAKTIDAVETFLDVDYMTTVLGRIEEQAGTRVKDAAATVKHVAKALSFDEVTADGVLDHFIRGGQMTAGGVLQAVTSYAQVVADPDKAASLEDNALRALELAASMR